MKSHRLLLITGGSRSGKTAYALERAMRFGNRVYLATAESIDPEMKDRIQRHQEERANNFTTLEESIHLAGAFDRIPEDTDVVLVDCMTVWLGNLMHHRGVQTEAYDEVLSFLEKLKNLPTNVIIVTNEIGSGIVPPDSMTRTFRDHAGWLNQDIAKIADEVVLVACGLPLSLKNHIERGKFES